MQFYMTELNQFDLGEMQKMIGWIDQFEMIWFLLKSTLVHSVQKSFVATVAGRSKSFCYRSDGGD